MEYKHGQWDKVCGEVDEVGDVEDVEKENVEDEEDEEDEDVDGWTQCFASWVRGMWTTFSGGAGGCQCGKAVVGVSAKRHQAR